MMGRSSDSSHPSASEGDIRSRQPSRPVTTRAFPALDGSGSGHSFPTPNNSRIDKISDVDPQSTPSAVGLQSRVNPRRIHTSSSSCLMFLQLGEQFHLFRYDIGIRI